MPPGATSSGNGQNGAKGKPTPRMLPPGMTAEQFQQLATRLQDAVGGDNFQVLSPATKLDDGDYVNVDCQTHDMHFLYDRDDFIGSCLVHPRKGHNLGYGGAAPRVPGSVVMNLGTHMNRILKVNTDDCYAIVEPGVTYMELQDHLRKHKLQDKVWLDCPELGYGSIIGNALDHGVGFTPYGDHWTFHCGMESPEGRHQAAAGVPPQDQEPNECRGLFPYGFGPVNDGIFSQSGNGIVTKMGVWLMPAPPGYEPFMITYENEDGLAAVVDIVRPLRVSVVLQNAAALRHISLDASHYRPRSFYADKPLDEPLTEEEFSAAAKKIDMCYWVYMGRRVRAQAGAGRAPRHHQGIGGWCELRWLSHWMPNCSFLSFSPISKASGESAKAQYGLAKRRFKEARLDYMGILSVGLREMHNVICVVFDRENVDMRRRAQWLVRTMIKDCADNGWGEFRTHTSLMGQVAMTYDFDDNALMRLNEIIKNALDPKGILAPGKSGI
ncbi:hypothetical protein GGTG_04540 [Gaeumannomyces tritici R3-111a-1]|uniref:FAD-binding PCMH-type domain-containing protein n=1 Tax=Gaeumannomyces tritici (strain R3-111a-1) TaxID=644352 RepID=J3NTE1_GAET3|nr:hypothetical protein GGTG_04540 [Gaeumannomyces tritici R3-111a-1]EJT79456.1 hypothetical protein GGTG_04540 [Gaeumannomyces tritici R3-111a-1]